MDMTYLEVLKLHRDFANPQQLPVQNKFQSRKMRNAGRRCNPKPDKQMINTGTMDVQDGTTQHKRRTQTHTAHTAQTGDEEHTYGDIQHTCGVTARLPALRTAHMNEQLHLCGAPSLLEDFFYFLH